MFVLHETRQDKPAVIKSIIRRFSDCSPPRGDQSTERCFRVAAKPPFHLLAVISSIGRIFFVINEESVLHVNETHVTKGLRMGTKFHEIVRSRRCRGKQAVWSFYHEIGNSLARRAIEVF